MISEDKLSILLVEEDEDDRIMTKDILSKIDGSDFDVEWINNFPDAERAIRSCTYDVYLVDYKLGDENGLDLLKLVGSRNPTSPVIMLSGRGGRDVDAETMKAGASYCLNKEQADAQLVERSIRYTVNMARKMEESRMVNKHLAIMNRMKSEFVANASHELRTPISSIKCFIEILKDEIDDQNLKGVLKYIGIVDKECDRLIRLINNLLDLGKIETSENSYHEEVVNLENLISEIVEKNTPLALKSGVSIMCNLPEDIPAVYADQDRITQVLENLISNALKFSSEGGTVTLCMEADNISESKKNAKTVVISVHDNGTGISPENREIIFERFRQAEGPYARRKGGTGLGLSICKEIVEYYGGKIWVESEIDKGSTFYFTIPIREEGHQNDVEAMGSGASNYLVRNDLNPHQFGRAIRRAMNMSCSVEQDCKTCEELRRQVERRKEVEEELVETKKVAEIASGHKTEFLANMSHEIRTPMNAIIGVAELLQETDLTQAQMEYVRIFKRAGENLLEVISDVLDLSRVEAGHFELNDVDFDVEETVKMAIEVLSFNAHEKGLELTYRIHSEVPILLCGDPVRLRQVLINLVGNAVKFTKKGEVSLDVNVCASKESKGSVDQCTLIFEIKDTGIGIPQEKLDLIFDSFVQADASISRQYGGTGLGTTISKRIVEKMGGRIWAESIEGEGTKFYFTVDFKLTSKSVRKRASNIRQLNGANILVIDDCATNRIILTDGLSGMGISVTEAINGKEGIDALCRARDENRHYDVILLDNYMPVMNGIEMMKKLKEEYVALDVPPIVMLSSTNQFSGTINMNELGVVAWLLKPVRTSELINVVERICENKSTNESLEVPENRGHIDILLAEDSEDNRLLISTFLKEMPWHIDVALNGEAAVEKFKQGRYNIVLMDMQMPVMDGYEATREIRRFEAEKRLAFTPVLALTANAFKEDEQKSLNAGCTAHITKPISKSVLIATINSHVFLNHNQNRQGGEYEQRECSGS